jgi:hypothetical protein
MSTAKTVKIDVTPYSALPVPVERQQKIINAINARLAVHPRHSLCFIGSPGVGKTYLMNKIQEASLASGNTYTKPIVSKIVTLGEWHDSNLQASREGRQPGLISATRIRKVVGENNMWASYGSKQSNTLHYFIDEFDSQATVSDFTSGNLQNFVNSVYTNAYRPCEGNETDYVQFVIAMNKSWAEFVEANGQHVARRIKEMCAIIDFDKGTLNVAPAPTKVDKAIDALCGGE